MARAPLELKQIFLRGPALAALAVLGLCALILYDLISTYSHQTVELRAIDVARTIDTAARTSRDPSFLGNYLTDLSIQNDPVEVVIVNRDRRVIASTNRLWTNEYVWSLPDKRLGAALEQSLSMWQFSSSVPLAEGERAAILPLSDASSSVWPLPIPRWYSAVDTGAIPVDELVSHGMTRQPQLAFARKTGDFGGVIAVVMRPDLETRLAFPWMIASIGMIGLALIAMLLAIWVACKQYVVTPLDKIMSMIAAQRAGDRCARIPALETVEFGRLGESWNALIEERIAANQRNRILASMLEHLPIGVGIYAPDGTVEYVNPRVIAKCGNLTRIRFPGPLEEAVRTGHTWSGVQPLKTSAGDERLLQMQLTPVHDENGDVERVIGVYHDITDLKQNEQRLIVERQKAETAMRAKADFIAMMSHELRTPLNAVIGFASIIATEQAGPINNPAYREFAQLIDQSATMLLSIINTIIDLNRLEKGSSAVEEEAFAPGLLIERVIASHEPQIAQRGIEVKFVDHTRKSALHADPRQVRKVLAQLLSNAIKFNREKDPKIVVRAVLDKDKRIAISVADTGIGIAEDAMTHVTEPFFQADAGTTRQHEGSGLGLTLVKAMVAAMDAELSIRSRAGHGTTVTVTFGPERTVKPNGTRGRAPRRAHAVREAAIA
ncbi:MAG: ATP-binding protein [Hyphomicrobiales bacterium]